ncbi:MAG TPA: hypothetical protein VKB46_01635 [Pyrinomonadaceae bacterium]|nr:hypothetical protein [Pyrinomonadaceae bacterium]
MKMKVDMRSLWTRTLRIRVSAPLPLGLSRWITGLFLLSLVCASAQAASYVYAAKPTNTVVVVGTSTNTEIATIQVNEEPSGIAVTPDGTFVYLVNNLSQTISVIDTETNTLATTIPVGRPILAIAMNPKGRFAYVTMGSSPGEPLRSFIGVVDTSSNTVVTTIPYGGVDSGAEDLAVTPDGRFVYVPTAGAFSGGNIFVISTETNTVVDVIPTSLVHRIAFTPDGAFAYLTEVVIEGKVLVLDTATRAIVAGIQVRAPNTGGYPNGVAISPDGKFAYVTAFDDLKIIDVASRTVVATRTLPFAAEVVPNLALTPDSSYLYATSRIGPMMVFDTKHRVFLDPAPGRGPLAITPPRPCGEDITSKTPVAKSPLSPFLFPQLQLQLVAVGNTTMGSIKGPITLVLNNVSNASFVGNSLQTKCFAQGGSPYITMGAGADNIFSPGEVLFFPLTFLQTGPGNITYTQRVISGVPTK